MSERPDPFKHDRSRSQFLPADPRMQQKPPTRLSCSCGKVTQIEADIPHFWPVQCTRCGVTYMGAEYSAYKLPDAEEIVRGIGALEAYASGRYQI